MLRGVGFRIYLLAKALRDYMCRLSVFSTVVSSPTPSPKL